MGITEESEIKGTESSSVTLRLKYMILKCNEGSTGEGCNTCKPDHYPNDENCVHCQDYIGYTCDKNGTKVCRTNYSPEGKCDTCTDKDGNPCRPREVPTAAIAGITAGILVALGVCILRSYGKDLIDEEEEEEEEIYEEDQQDDGIYDTFDGPPDQLVVLERLHGPSSPYDHYFGDAAVYSTTIGEEMPHTSSDYEGNVFRPAYYTLDGEDTNDVIRGRNLLPPNQAENIYSSSDRLETCSNVSRSRMFLNETSVSRVSNPEECDVANEDDPNALYSTIPAKSHNYDSLQSMRPVTRYVVTGESVYLNIPEKSGDSLYSTLNAEKASTSADITVQALPSSSHIEDGDKSTYSTLIAENRSSFVDNDATASGRVEDCPESINDETDEIVYTTVLGRMSLRWKIKSPFVTLNKHMRSLRGQFSRNRPAASPKHSSDGNQNDEDNSVNFT